MEIHISQGDHWEILEKTMVSGTAFIDGERFSQKALADRISAVGEADELKKILSQANGFFSVIHDTGDQLCIAVDHVRSWPLYYAVTDDIYVSDSAEWVHEAGANCGYDPIAATELLFTCFVSGSDTLSRDVKQVQAGEVVTFQRGGSEPTGRRERYFVYEPSECTGSADCTELDEVLVDAFENLIEYADGRTILLGLSSGYDSKLIALMLRRLGYDNTITYTDRAASASQEVSVAKSIAEDLDFEHIEIKSAQSDYRGFKDSDRMELVRDIGYLSEYPHIIKVIMRKKIVEAGINPDNVVHVLGHHMLGTSLLPETLRDCRTLNRDEFFEIMWNLHYSKWETPNNTQWRSLFEGRMFDKVPIDLYRNGPVEPTSDAVQGFEQWYWQERLPKYIIERRESEYTGFDSWYPLLDRGVFSYFSESDYRDRIGKRILKEYVDKLDAQVRGVSPRSKGKAGRESRSVGDIVWDQAVRTVYALPDPAMDFIRRVYNFHYGKDLYERDPRYAIVSRETFESISFPKYGSEGLHRTLLFLYLYDNGFFDLSVQTEFDRALS